MTVYFQLETLFGLKTGVQEAPIAWFELANDYWFCELFWKFYKEWLLAFKLKILIKFEVLT